MQFNSFLFPGPGMQVMTDYTHIVYIPRGRLPPPVEEEKKFTDQKLSKS